MYFFTFQYCVQKFSALYLLSCKLFCYFFNGFKLVIKFCFFFIPITRLFDKIVFGSYSHFLLTFKSNACKTAIRSINVFYKCALEFNFACISETLDFLKKSQNRWRPMNNCIIFYCTLFLYLHLPSTKGIKLARQYPIPLSNTCPLREPPCFSLYNTFKDMLSLFQCSAVQWLYKSTVGPWTE